MQFHLGLTEKELCQYDFQLMKHSPKIGMLGSMTGQVWKGFSDHFKELFRGLSYTNDYSDVTLVSEDLQEFRAHRAVLSSCSRTLRKILKTVMTDRDLVISLSEIKSEEVKSILQYMYTGETVLQPDRVASFLEVAKELDIGDVKRNILNIATEENIEEVQLDSDDDIREEVSIIDNQLKDKSNPTEEICIKESFTLKPNSLPSQPSSAWFDFTMSNICPECGKDFSSDLSMKIHYKTQHSGVTYPCKRCEYVSKLKANVDKHVKNVHEIYQCKDCGFKIAGKRSLWLHTKSKHIQTRKNKK